MKPLALLILALLLSGTTLPAQEAGAAVKPFTRVRVHAPGVAAKALVGNAVLVDTDSLVLAQGGSTRWLVVPTDAVSRLEISRGRSHLGGALAGAGIGGLVGGVGLAGIAAIQERRVDGWTFAVLILGAVYGAPVGAAVGAVVGVERWETQTQWRVGMRAAL